MILVIAEPLDNGGRFLLREIRRRGLEALAVAASDFPARASISLAFGERGGRSYRLHRPERTVDLGDVSAIVYRGGGAGTPPEAVTDPQVRAFVASESRSLFRFFLAGYRGLWCPGPPEVVARAENKALQLEAAQAAGFVIPPTLMTTSPEDLLEFQRQHHSRPLVHKLIGSGSGFAQHFPHLSRYTEPLTAVDLLHVQDLRLCPVAFQAYVPKALELRVTVVGRQVYAAEILSQESNHAKHDWRRYDIRTTPHRPHALPEAVAARCLAVTEAFQLNYGAIDLILRPDGEYVFIEINPVGSYGWVEELTGLPITDALCQLLAQGPTASTGA
jgi:glutathione synthase/RimK-type ligase-like ATP-grasp enzyme